MIAGNLVIVGAGGFGREVLDIVRDQGKFNPIGFLDSDPTLHGISIDGCSILGGDGILQTLKAEKQVDSVFIAVSDSRIRKRLSEICSLLDFNMPNLIHPQAYLSNVSTIGIGNVFYPGCVVMSGCHIGNNNLVNAGATIGHETIIEDFCAIGPGVHIAGRARIKEGALIGIGASVKEKLVISEYAIVGAGSAVVKNVPPHTTVYGIAAHQSDEHGRR